MRSTEMPRVAFQGESGAYSEEALLKLFGGRAEPLPCRDFAAVGAAVDAGAADYGLLPIENSLAGSVVGSYDVLLSRDLTVVGEVIHPIHHCVLGVEGASLEGVRRVLSHPVALAQCTRFFDARPETEAVAAYDTAGAARLVAERGERAVAAIAGRGAARIYGLEILAGDVEDRPDNQTRFLAVVRADRANCPDRAARVGLAAPLAGAAGAAMKSMLVVDVENRPGSLVEVLLCFSSRGINLTKLESRPGERPWTYRFFLELDADAASPSAAEAIEAVRAGASGLRVLGSFRGWA